MCGLQHLINRGGYSVHVAINEHRDEFISVSQKLRSMWSLGDTDNLTVDLSDSVREKMIEIDTIIVLQFYIPGGVHKILHYDIDLAINEALKILQTAAPN